MSRTFDDMPTLRTSPSSSPSSARTLRKSYARRLERCCCRALSYFPLLFVHGVTGWAVWVAVSVALIKSSTTSAYLRALFVAVLYGLANLSYSVAVFTNPGSPLDERVDLSIAGRGRSRNDYQGLPTYESEDRSGDFDARHLGPMTTVTAKSSGQPRYCKKCKTVKPDRAHHCSSCGRCVLKMDHHCPWLATCVGLRNYKAFLLFLVYTSIFCWTCFFISVSWVWNEIIDDIPMEEGMWIVNTILLAVLGGVIGLVLSGFTGWHIYLTLTGQTTIESLEKTRYLTPLQKTLQVRNRSERTYIADEPSAEAGLRSIGNHLKDIHANALPGVLRPEEGEGEQGDASPSPQGSPSPAKAHLLRSYASLEAQREQDRYNSYLDEQDSEKLPNAFNLGWKRNFRQVFGNQAMFWFVPVANSCGDGWQWEVSPKWHEARDRVASERASRSQMHGFQGPSGRAAITGPNQKWQNGHGLITNQSPRGLPPRADATLADRNVPLQPMDRRKLLEDETRANESSSSSSSDDSHLRTTTGTSNWNDVPDEYFRSANGSAQSHLGRNVGQMGKGKGD